MPLKLPAQDPQSTPSAMSRPAAAGALPSVVGQNLKITGNLEGECELEIEGQIYGDIRCNRIILGKSARVEGNITANEIVIRGKVTGIIRANRAIVQEGADVKGDIFYRRLALEEGAQFEGAIRTQERPIETVPPVAEDGASINTGVLARANGHAGHHPLLTSARRTARNRASRRP